MAPTCSTKKVRLGDFRGWYDSGFAGIIWFPAPTQFLSKTIEVSAIIYVVMLTSIVSNGRSTDWAPKLAGDRTHEWGSWWLLRSKSDLQTLSDPPQFYVFLQKRAFFRFCGRDPSKMTILAPSRKTVRIGLYRGVEKGPKSTFFGWSGFGVFGFSKKISWASHPASPTPVVIASKMRLSMII